MNETTPTVGPHRTMLLVMDYQPAILNNLPDADELLTRMAGVIHTARTSGVQIGYVRVAFDDADYAVMPETNKALKAIAAGRHMHHEAGSSDRDLDVHNFLTQKIFPRQAYVISIADLSNLLEVK